MGIGIGVKKSGIAHVCCTYLVAAYLVNFLLELLLVLMSCDFDWLFEVRRVLGSEGSREEGCGTELISLNHSIRGASWKNTSILVQAQQEIRHFEQLSEHCAQPDTFL